VNGVAEIYATTVGLLGKLVAFDSVSRNSNLPIIAFIEDYLRTYGVACETVPSPDGKKCNLLARIGPDAPGGVALSGHSDVVPVDGQSWDSDPFMLTEKGEKFFGRGTSDMKSFIAVCLAFVPELKKLKLSKPMYLAFSYDEEVGCLGVPHLLEHIEGRANKPDFVLIGEPTMMQVVTAHKGVRSFETTVQGLEWHSSQPHYGINAVQVACGLIKFLSELGTKLRDERFDPAWTTVHVGVIAGGTARNIIPKECHFNWEIRPLPGEDADALFAKFEEECAKAAKKTKAVITTQPISRMMGVTLPPEAASWRQAVMRAANTNREHAVSFGTEAGVFQDYGIPAIICGPGNIEQAHKPNEFIETAQIKDCIDFLSRLAQQLAAT
jgi:acetylornithine deacetylase